MPFGGVIVNRVHHGVEHPDLEAVERELAGELGDKLAGKVASNLGDYQVIAERDAAGIARLARELGDRPLLEVPQFDSDVHDVEGLLRIHRYLFATAKERRAMLSDLVA